MVTSDTWCLISRLNVGTLYPCTLGDFFTLGFTLSSVQLASLAVLFVYPTVSCYHLVDPPHPSTVSIPFSCMERIEVVCPHLTHRPPYHFHTKLSSFRMLPTNRLPPQRIFHCANERHPSTNTPPTAALVSPTFHCFNNLLLTHFFPLLRVQ